MAKVKSSPINRLSTAQVKGSPTNQLSTARVEDYTNRLSHLKTMAPHIKTWLFDNPDVRVVDGVGTTIHSNVVITTVETVYTDVCLETVYKDVCLWTYFFLCQDHEHINTVFKSRCEMTTFFITAYQTIIINYLTVQV